MTAPDLAVGTTPDMDPISVARVVLTVHDLARVGDYYQKVLGLSRISGDAESLMLGAGERPLLELRRDPAARFRSPREAGLFHTAFLLPARADLGRWTKRAIEAQIPVQGLSDHLVSEAIYLADPEGNGIEIYADRPRDSWRWTDGSVAMTTEALDVESLLADAPGQWAGAPAGTMVGHVHLQVGSVIEAEAFYHGRLGFDITTHYPGAVFLATGGYHHHLAANIWNSRNAGPRQMPSTGLAEVVLNLREDAPVTAEAGLMKDPWGTPIRLSAA